MKIEFYKNNWGDTSDLKLLAAKAEKAGFSGLEIEAQGSTAANAELRAITLDHNLKIIGEASTASEYVLPRRDATVDEHIESLRQQVDELMQLEPQFVNSLSGCDAWSDAQNVEFFGRAIEVSKDFGVVISHETHRGRSFFNPWVTQRVCQQLPELKLCADYSHWCVVTERLLQGEESLLTGLAKQVHHIHCRVGYDQGPQVPNPRAPEYSEALIAHQSWWREIWQAQHSLGYDSSSMNPEWGVDGYMHEQPFTQEPVANLWQLQQDSVETEAKHFRRWREGLYD